MSEQVPTSEEITPWVLISVYRDDTNPADLATIAPQIRGLVDEWQSAFRMMWSGALDDNRTGLAIFEATESDANLFYAKYDKICAGILEYSLYRWDAMPVLSVLS